MGLFFARRHRNERGGAVIETALSVVVFFAMVVGVLDFGRIQYVRSNLQHAVSQSTRYAAIGDSIEDPDAPGADLSREASIVYLIRDISGFADIDASDVEITAVKPDGSAVVGAGAAGDIVSIAVTYRVPLLAPFVTVAFPGGLYVFTVRTSFRNEEFLAAAPRPVEAGVPA